MDSQKLNYNGTTSILVTFINAIFVGSIFLAILGTYHCTFPKFGFPMMFSFASYLQLFFEVIVGFLGWLNLPIVPIAFKRIIAVIAMLNQYSLI